MTADTVADFVFVSFTINFKSYSTCLTANHWKLDFELGGGGDGGKHFQGGHPSVNVEKSVKLEKVGCKSGKLWFACGVLPVPQLRWSQNKRNLSTVK